MCAPSSNGYFFYDGHPLSSSFTVKNQHQFLLNEREKEKGWDGLDGQTTRKKETDQ